MGHSLGFFGRALTYLTPKSHFATHRTIWGSKRSRSLEKSLEMPHDVLPAKKKLPDFQNQQYIIIIIVLDRLILVLVV
jgi:hypothetical protein